MLDMTGGRRLGSLGVPNLKLAVKNNPCIAMRSLKKTIPKTRSERFSEEQDAKFSTCQRPDSIFIDGGIDRHRPGRFP
jgi:hypothetical protein